MSKVTTTAEMVTKTAETTGYPEKEVAAVIRAYLFEVQRQLDRQNAVELENFGIFRNASMKVLER